MHASSAEPETPSEAGPVWRLRVLGGFELDDGQHRLTRLRSRAAVALLVRLAMAPGRRFERDALGRLLWPDTAPTRARTRLRQTLSLLKAVLEPPGSRVVIGADRDAVWAEPGAIWCDAAAFGAAAAAARHLYHGPLLPGFYDEWVLAERARLEALAERVHAATPAPTASAAGAPQPAAHGPQGDRLPRDPTALIGAEAMLSALLALAADARWVTVLGPGGVGKTRLATEAARRLHGRGALHRALFVSLVGALHADDLFDRLCDALQLGRPTDPREPLLDALGSAPTLLLLDNAEDLSPDAVACLAFLAERLPGVSWLATSRRPLQLDGERCFTVEPLALPAVDGSLEDLVRSPSATLYLARARLHRAEIHASRGNQQALTALLHQLEGLPLAIELAAAQARSAGPAELLAALSPAAADGAAWPLRLQRRHARHANGRHGSLWAVIDWSWRLLTAQQQGLLQALCLLPAGVPTQLALRMASPALSRTAALAALDDLVAHSLLRERSLGGLAARWHVSEPVRAHALALLDDGRRRALRRRIVTAYVGWAADATPRPALEAQRAELGNLAEVLAWALEDGSEPEDPGDAGPVRLLVSLASFQLFTLSGQTLARACEAVARCADAELRCMGNAELSWYLLHAGRREDARRCAERALSELPTDAPRPKARALNAAIRQRLVDGVPADALAPLLVLALRCAEQAGDWGCVGALRTLRAIVAAGADRPLDEQRVLHHEALAAWERWGDRDALCGARYNLATIEVDHGSVEVAAQMLPPIVEEARALGNWRLLANATDAMSQALRRQRRWPEALAAARESLRLTARFGLRYTMTETLLWNLPPLLARQRRGEDALRLLAYGEHRWQRTSAPMSQALQRRLVRLRRLVHATVSTERRSLCRDEGVALSESQALDLAWRD